MPMRAELKAAVSELERPWEVVERSPTLFSIKADEQLKVLADRFQKPGGFDMWSERHGPQLFETRMRCLLQEIVEEILHRLPVKSIVKCTSVCKAWNSLITRQTFVYDNLNRTIQPPNHNSSLFFQFRKLISPDDPRSVHLEETYSLYSSVNQQTDQFSVERNNDYKVVRLMNDRSTKCRYKAYDVAAYDEEGVRLNYRLLPVEGGHLLAMVDHVYVKTRSELVLCIWVMKDYGNTNSWTEIFRLDSELYGGIFKVLALTSSGKVVLILYGGAIVLVDPIKESVEPVGLAKMSEVFVSSFVESLFFLNKEPDVLSF
ncbi:hypothetical protein K1719_032889 [Acacia pycnantha]|nr:hypothetical protein K1719_032889 [Acacia pycnantha]